MTRHRKNPKPPFPSTNIHWSWTLHGSTYGKNGGMLHGTLDAAVRRLKLKSHPGRMGGEIYRLEGDQWVLVATHDGGIDSDVVFV